MNLNTTSLLLNMNCLLAWKTKSFKKNPKGARIFLRSYVLYSESFNLGSGLLLGKEEEKVMNNGESSYRRSSEIGLDALECLVIKYNKKLVFYLFGLVNDLDAAEDLAADSFLKLYTKNPRIKDEAALKAYLYRTAHNCAVDYLRALSRRKKLCVETELNEETAADVLSLEEEFVKDERQKQVRHALSRLKSDYRDVLYLIYFEEMSYDDVATVLKKSRKQVGNLAYRAKQALEAELVKEGFNYENG